MRNTLPARPYFFFSVPVHIPRLWSPRWATPNCGTDQDQGNWLMYGRTCDDHRFSLEADQ
jgi:hypothetical protein